MNKDKLWTVPDEDLQAELERRKKKADAPPKMRKFVIDSDPEISKAAEALRMACVGYVEQVLDDHPEPKSYIESAAMTLFYGEGYWDWHNKRRA